MEKYDILVIGAGITGLSSAYHVKKENPDMRICVVDRASTYAQGNTAKSQAAFRDVFVSEINYKLSSSSISYYRDVQSRGNDLGMHFNGYLFLMDKERLNSPTIDMLHKKVRSKILGRDEVSAMGFTTDPDPEAAKIMNLKNIDGAFFGENCGILEPDLLASYYKGQLEKMGVEFKFNTNVKKLSLQPMEKLDFPGEPFIWQDKVIDVAETNNGTIKADQFLLATDVWTNHLTDPLGIDPLTLPKKVQVFQVDGEAISKMVANSYVKGETIFPFTILPEPDICLRPDPKSKMFWISYDEGIGRGFELDENPRPEPDFYSNNLYTVLREYVPAFVNSRVSSSWAGYYSMNNLDGSYILTKQMNLSIITGSSGSGIMKADSAGRLSSALISGNEVAKLYDGMEIRVSDLGISNRKVDQETIII